MNYLEENILKKWKEYVRPNLYKYLVEQIIPKYEVVDPSHNIQHIIDVLTYAFHIAKNVCVQKKFIQKEMEIIFAAVVYHDISLSLFAPRKTHHIDSAEYLRNDKKMLEYFKSDELEIIINAIEDHRASAINSPRSLIGKIVADADTGPLNIDTIIQRSYHYHKNRYAKNDNEAIFNEIKNLLHMKYGKNGYIRYWLHESEDYFSTLKGSIKKELFDDEAYIEYKIKNCIENMEEN